MGRKILTGQIPERNVKISKRNMRLTIITINHNSSENTIKLLESLKNQTEKDFEVIVIDNNSDNVGKLMDYETPETNIIYIKNDRNLGYSGGNNAGIKKALENGADWVLLLNNDTWVESSFIERLRAVLDSSAGSGQRGKEGIIGLALDEGSRTSFAGLIQWLKPTLIHITTFKVVMIKTVDNLDLKSPIFKPNPGWGGKLKKWLAHNGLPLFFLLWVCLLLFFLLLR